MSFSLRYEEAMISEMSSHFIFDIFITTNIPNEFTADHIERLGFKYKICKRWTDGSFRQ